MANKRRTPVQFRKFEARPLLAEGLLPVARGDGGELEARVAAGMFRLAGQMGRVADREAVLDGTRRGEADALAGAPRSLAGSSLPAGGSSRPSRAQVNAPAAIRDTISRAAVRHGVDPGALLKIAELESSFNPQARNTSSSAGGLFQFIDSTAADYGLADRFDPSQAADAAARLAKDNAASLRKVLGRDPTAGELYLAHQQGAGGAAKLAACRTDGGPMGVEHHDVARASEGGVPSQVSDHVLDDERETFRAYPSRAGRIGIEVQG